MSRKTLLILIATTLTSVPARQAFADNSITVDSKATGSASPSHVLESTSSPWHSPTWSRPTPQSLRSSQYGEPLPTQTHVYTNTARGPKGIEKGQSADARSVLERDLMHRASTSPLKGDNVFRIPNANSDPRFDHSNGWQKFQRSGRDEKGNPVVVHYQYNAMLNQVADVKGVTRMARKPLPSIRTVLKPPPAGVTVKAPATTVKMQKSAKARAQSTPHRNTPPKKSK